MKRFKIGILIRYSLDRWVYFTHLGHIDPALAGFLSPDQRKSSFR